MKKDIVLKDVEIPEGYEETGEFRPPKDDEPFLDDVGKLQIALFDFSDEAKYIILRKVAVKDDHTTQRGKISETFYMGSGYQRYDGHNAKVEADIDPGFFVAVNVYSAPLGDHQEYRSFELDWTTQNWPSCSGAVINTGRLIFEKWRIFAFGDDQWFDPDKTYSTTASHRTGNYKYAYGRLEK